MEGPNKALQFGELAVEIMDSLQVRLFILDPNFGVFWANKTIR